MGWVLPGEAHASHNFRLARRVLRGRSRPSDSNLSKLTLGPHQKDLGLAQDTFYEGILSGRPVPEFLREHHHQGDLSPQGQPWRGEQVGQPAAGGIPNDHEVDVAGGVIGSAGYRAEEECQGNTSATSSDALACLLQQAGRGQPCQLPLHRAHRLPGQRGNLAQVEPAGRAEQQKLQDGHSRLRSEQGLEQRSRTYTFCSHLYTEYIRTQRERQVRAANLDGG